MESFIIDENVEFREKEKQSMIYKAMGNTAWGKMAFDNTFAYNDITNVGKVNMKGFKPITSEAIYARYELSTPPLAPIIQLYFFPFVSSLIL